MIQIVSVTERPLWVTNCNTIPVMIDTFHPLHLTMEAKKIDDDRYPYSWFEEKESKKVEAEE